MLLGGFVMRVNLLNEGYKDNKEFYQAFLDDSLWQSSYVSEDYINIPEEIPDFRIYFANKDEEVRETEFIDTIKICAEYVIKLDRDIAMDECFWHSYLCLYKRQYLLDTYPQLKEGYDQFKRIIIKKFDWENYIYKAILIAQYVDENIEPKQYEKYYRLILQNMDMFNYIIKYEIFRNGSFLIKIMDIIDETGLSKVLKPKIKNRPDLGQDERYGRRVIFELNKAYPIVMSPMLDEQQLKEYFLKYLGYYYDGGNNENIEVVEEEI